MKLIDHSEIYDRPQDYDNINNFDFDIDFFVEQSNQNGQSVLELGCGTGRIAIPLAKNGLEVVGVDMSETMLQRATEKSDAEKLEVEWLQMDIRDFSLDRKFDTIICAHNTLNHLHDLESVQSFFACVKQHLAEKGRFILQVFMPDLEILNADPEDKNPFLKYKEEKTGKEVEITESSFYDDENQIHYVKWFTQKEGEEPTTEHMNVRVFFPQELDNLVRLMGFEIENKYGDFDLAPFEEYQDSQILICKLK